MLTPKTTNRLDSAASNIAKFHCREVLIHGVGVHNQENHKHNRLAEWKTTLRDRRNHPIFTEVCNFEIKLENILKTPIQFEYLANKINDLVDSKMDQCRSIVEA